MGWATNFSMQVSVKHLDGPWVDLPVTVDAVAAQRLDVSAIWDTKKFEGLFVDSKDPLPITIRTAFDGFPKPTSVEFTAKVTPAGSRLQLRLAFVPTSGCCCWSSETCSYLCLRCPCLLPEVVLSGSFLCPFHTSGGVCKPTQDDADRG